MNFTSENKSGAPLHMVRVKGSLVKCSEENAKYRFNAIFHGLGNNYIVCHYENPITKRWAKAKFQGKLWNEAKQKLSEHLNMTERDWPVMSNNSDL